MAWITEVQTGTGPVYRVRWRETGRQGRSKNFRDRAEAERYRSEIEAKLPAKPQRSGPAPIPLNQRIRNSIQEDENGCWLWQRRIHHTTGYGVLTISRNGKPASASAHRVSYETFRGPIPEGLVIDHLCRVRACVNPEHLEPVTRAENSQRSPIHPSVVNRKSNPGDPCTAEKHGTTGMRQRYGCCCIEAFEDQRKATRNYTRRKREAKARAAAEAAALAPTSSAGGTR